MRFTVYDFNDDKSFSVERIAIPHIVPIIFDRRVVGRASEFVLNYGVLSARLETDTDLAAVHFNLQFVRSPDGRGLESIMSLEAGRPPIVDADNELALYVLNVPRSGSRALALDLFAKGRRVVHELSMQDGCVGFPWADQAFSLDRFVADLREAKGKIVHLVREPVKVVASLASSEWLKLAAPVILDTVPEDPVQTAIEVHSAIVTRIASLKPRETWKVEDLGLEVLNSSAVEFDSWEYVKSRATEDGITYLRRVSDELGYAVVSSNKLAVQ